MESRICQKCNISKIKSIDNFRLIRGKTWTAKCKACLSEDRERKRLEMQQWFESRKLPERPKTFKLSQSERTKIKYNKHRLELSDKYITTLLKVNESQVPKEVIETKRLIIQIKQLNRKY